MHYSQGSDSCTLPGHDNAQLARLCDEARAVLTLEQIAEMAVSMDLKPVEVETLFEQASAIFENAKASLDDQQMLSDGERRVMPPGALRDAEKERVVIIAERADEDTPFVILGNPETNAEIVMSDSLAEDVVSRLKRAVLQLPKMRNDGEQRIMRPSSHGGENARVIIIAERMDADTAIVILRDPESSTEIHMSQGLAEDVGQRINAALQILPSSK